MGGRSRWGLALAVILAALVWGSISGGAQEPVRCRGEIATIVADGGRVVWGTPGRDVIVGTGRGEVIRGRGGVDLICGRGGPDRIHGGAGDDVIRGNRGNDRIDGGAGDDVIRGNDGNDVLGGRLGDDLLDGGAGDDLTLGGPGIDRCIGGIGSDRRRGCETEPAAPAPTPAPTPPVTPLPVAAEPANASDPVPTVEEMPPPPAGAVVSFTFDDGWISQATVAQPLLERFGYRGTFYLLSGYLGVFPYLSEAQARALHAAGHEVGSHTISHPHLPRLSTDELRRELAISRNDLEAAIGVPVNHFASPYGEADARVLTEVRPVYSSHRGVLEGLNRRGLTDRYDIRVRNVLNTTSQATVEAWLDEAIANDAWLVLVYHDVIDAPRTYDTTAAALEAHLGAARARNLDGATVGQALVAFAGT